MQQRIGRDDFRRTNELQMSGHQSSDVWWVYSEYEVEEDPQYGGETWEQEFPPYLIKPKSSYVTTRRYRPLEETPHLFVEFARLYDKGFSVERIMDWVHRYGTLNYSRFSQYSAHRSKHPNTVKALWGEVCWAAGVLRLYEAALNGDTGRAQRLAQNDFRFMTPDHDTRPLFASDEGIDRSEFKSSPINSPLWKKNVGDGAEEVANLVDSRYFGDYLAYALDVSVWAVDDVVQGLCFPTLYVPEFRLNNDPSQIRGGWGFKNLLGAMYMQMRWLMASGADLKRCLFCGRIISLAPPAPGVRKPRSNKKFCNKSCRQNYDYHNRRKPEDQSKSAQG